MQRLTCFMLFAALAAGASPAAADTWNSCTTKYESCVDLCLNYHHPANCTRTCYKQEVFCRSSGPFKVGPKVSKNIGVLGQSGVLTGSNPPSGGPSRQAFPNTNDNGSPGGGTFCRGTLGNCLGHKLH